jgi:hypothetical protein
MRALFFALALVAGVVNAETPQQAVERLPCVKDGTVGANLKQRAAIPAATDLGWKTEATVSARKDWLHSLPSDDGFIVERSLLILRSPTVWRWHVSPAGVVTPVNGHAIGLADHCRER